MAKDNLTQTTNFTAEQIEEIESMITNRIVIFHNALLEREQISPPSEASRRVQGTPTPKPDLKVVT